MLTFASTRTVEKPWGRTDVPAAFGDLAGRRIGEIWFEDPAGDAAPQLVKFLFTSERLSIQVHRGDEAAQSAGHARGKEDCWLILSADPHAALGVRPRAPSASAQLRSEAPRGGQQWFCTCVYRGALYPS